MPLSPVRELLRAVAQPLPGGARPGFIRSTSRIPSFVCVRHRNKQAPSHQPRMLQQQVARGNDGTSAVC